MAWGGNRELARFLLSFSLNGDNIHFEDNL